MMSSYRNEQLDELRRGPWTLDEDNRLIHYITCHGEGRWNSLAKSSENLPGRTDNSIKNYWRTKVQKQASHLKINSNSKRFVEAHHPFWVPRFLEKAEHSSPPPSSSSFTSTSTVEANQKNLSSQQQGKETIMENIRSSSNISYSSNSKKLMLPYFPESSLKSGSYIVDNNHFDLMSFNPSNMQELRSSDISTFDFQMTEVDWMSNNLSDDTFWNIDDLW
ncbi:hypothetical protein L1987_79239 [Smallanthus sonchifolius]|uniref:Uncharacterized protein n=1 Tax=Smallanthus sonchifolius TaxID=185202 RepID=A0ACB8ZFX7_9ASTR|nr:hypothetical protein L1987_79239 [Smallanthus sonchifolius]